MGVDRCRDAATVLLLTYTAERKLFRLVKVRRWVVPVFCRPLELPLLRRAPVSKTATNSGAAVAQPSRSDRGRRAGLPGITWRCRSFHRVRATREGKEFCDDIEEDRYTRGGGRNLHELAGIGANGPRKDRRHGKGQGSRG